MTVRTEDSDFQMRYTATSIFDRFYDFQETFHIPFIFSTGETSGTSTQRGLWRFEANDDARRIELRWRPSDKSLRLTARGSFSGGGTSTIGSVLPVLTSYTAGDPIFCIASCIRSGNDLTFKLTYWYPGLADAVTVTDGPVDVTNLDTNTGFNRLTIAKNATAVIAPVPLMFHGPFCLDGAMSDDELQAMCESGRLNGAMNWVNGLQADSRCIFAMNYGIGGFEGNINEHNESVTASNIPLFDEDNTSNDEWFLVSVNCTVAGDGDYFNPLAWDIWNDNPFTLGTERANQWGDVFTSFVLQTANNNIPRTPLETPSKYPVLQAWVEERLNERVPIWFDDQSRAIRMGFNDPSYWPRGTGPAFYESAEAFNCRTQNIPSGWIDVIHQSSFLDNQVLSAQGYSGTMTIPRLGRSVYDHGTDGTFRGRTGSNTINNASSSFHKYYCNVGTGGEEDYPGAPMLIEGSSKFWYPTQAATKGTCRESFGDRTFQVGVLRGPGQASFMRVQTFVGTRDGSGNEEQGWGVADIDAVGDATHWEETTSEDLVPIPVGPYGLPKNMTVVSVANVSDYTNVRVTLATPEDLPVEGDAVGDLNSDLLGEIDTVTDEGGGEYTLKLTNQWDVGDHPSVSASLQYGFMDLYIHDVDAPVNGTFSPDSDRVGLTIENVFPGQYPLLCIPYILVHDRSNKPFIAHHGASGEGHVDRLLNSFNKTDSRDNMTINQRLVNAWGDGLWLIANANNNDDSGSTLNEELQASFDFGRAAGQEGHFMLEPPHCTSMLDPGEGMKLPPDYTNGVTQALLIADTEDCGVFVLSVDPSPTVVTVANHTNGYRVGSVSDIDEMRRYAVAQMVPVDSIAFHGLADSAHNGVGQVYSAPQCFLNQFSQVSFDENTKTPVSVQSSGVPVPLDTNNVLPL